MAIKKDVVPSKSTTEEATELWNKRTTPIPIKKYSKEAGDTEKMILFSETDKTLTEIINVYQKNTWIQPRDLIDNMLKDTI